MFGSVLAACGNASDSTTPTTVNLGKLDVQAGTDIPQATVRYGLLPYGDNSMPVIGMQKGWFDEVGITVQPQPVGSKVQDNQVVPKLVNDEIGVECHTASKLSLQKRRPKVTPLRDGWSG